MMTTFLSQFGQTIGALQILILVLTALVHLLIASGIAKDVGQLTKREINPLLLPGYAWVLAGLVGGIITLGLYWVIHYSSLSR